MRPALNANGHAPRAAALLVGGHGGKMHQLIAQYAECKYVKAAYEEFGIAVPESLLDTIRRLKLEIERVAEDDLRARLREKEARLEAIRTTEEKRVGLRQEIADLKARLEKK